MFGAYLDKLFFVIIPFSFASKAIWNHFCRIWEEGRGWAFIRIFNIYFRYHIINQEAMTKIKNQNQPSPGLLCDAMRPSQNDTTEQAY